MKKDKIAKEPLIHITKRDTMPPWQGILIRVGAVLIALAVSAVLVIVLTKTNPMSVFDAMFKGSFGSKFKVRNLMKSVATLLCISLAITPAFKMKFWNIGAEGQVLMGALAAAAVMRTMGRYVIPSWVVILVMLAAALVSGLIWAVIPAIFKALWNTNETLFTLMMNYVAMQIIQIFISIWIKSGSGVVGLINAESHRGWLPDLFGVKYLLNVIVVAGLTVFMFVYLKFSKHGYEISVVGESENTARYIGINVKKVVIRTMAISGALCGLAGFLLVAGADHTINKDLAGGMGFTAIMVSWLAKFNPFIMVGASFMLVFLDRGASNVATQCNLNDSVGEIITAIIIFFIIGCEFFIRYKINFRARTPKEKAPDEPEKP
ncbi:MAG: ABC transporter permease, partial [Clostridia bacterium]|nr:ABC transporter permease [Clostridia bacterium]